MTDEKNWLEPEWKRNRDARAAKQERASAEEMRPFAPWLIERKDNGLFDLYGTTNESGAPWRRPHLVAVDVDPRVAAWLANTGMAVPSFSDTQAIFRAERNLDGESIENRRSILDAVIAGLERRNVPRSMITYLRDRFETKVRP